MKITTSGKFDEETEYKVPMEGVPSSKYIITKLGPGKYKAINKDESGTVFEYNTTFTDGWCKMVKNLKCFALSHIKISKYLKFI